MPRINSRVARMSKFSGGVIPLARRRMRNQQRSISNLDKNEKALLLSRQELLDKFPNKQAAQSIHNRSKWFHYSPVNRTQEESMGENKDENQPSLKPVA